MKIILIVAFAIIEFHSFYNVAILMVLSCRLSRVSWLRHLEHSIFSITIFTNFKRSAFRFFQWLLSPGTPPSKFEIDVRPGDDS